MQGNAILLLEDGTIFQGKSFGAEKTISGEVVFNTGMVGYTEAITDPSYKGQILCQSYPLIGNYGISQEDFESDGPKIEGYIAREICAKPSHRTSQNDLNSFLASRGIPGISGIDTRALVLKLRERGVMLGVLDTTGAGTDELAQKISQMQNPNEKDLVGLVTVHKPIIYNPDGKKKIILIDCGAKFNIIRSLLKRKFQVVRVPAWYTASQIAEFEPDGIVISNGPGNPEVADYAISTIKKLMNNYAIMGICLGNQLLGLAAGAKTFKMKFGHRGQNHGCVSPSGKTFIVSQNHGYALSEESLDGTGFEILFRNADDKTVEGIFHKELPIFGVQFHPEASPGPTDTSFLFDKFKEMISGAKVRLD